MKLGSPPFPVPETNPVPETRLESPRKEITKMESWTRKVLRLLSRWYLAAWVFSILGLAVYAIAKEVFVLASFSWGLEAFVVGFVLFLIAIIYCGD